LRLSRTEATGVHQRPFTATTAVLPGDGSLTNAEIQSENSYG
jgi:hypothetical protein